MISLATYDTIKPVNCEPLLKKFDLFSSHVKKTLNIEFNYKITLGSRMHGECHSVFHDDGTETSNFLIRLSNKVFSFEETYTNYLIYHELAHIPQFMNYGTMFKHDKCFYESYVRVVPCQYWKYEVDYIPSSKKFLNRVCTKF